MAQYAIVLEKAEKNWAAYVPDLPGCVATGDTVPEVKRLIQEAIVFHLEGLREDGCPIPKAEHRVFLSQAINLPKRQLSKPVAAKKKPRQISATRRVVGK